MNKFLKNLGFFLSPFIIVIVIGAFKFSRTGGDLNRLGKIPYPKDYREQFKNEFDRINEWTNYSELDQDTITVFNIFIIGDSFSNINENSYQNYLVDNDLSVLNFDSYNFEIQNYNPIQFLNNFVDSNIIDNFKIDFIILQMVERMFIDNIKGAEREITYDIANLNDLVKDQKFIKKKNNFFKLGDIIQYCRNGILYEFNDHAFRSSVYKVELTTPLFSANDYQLTFLEDDISYIYSLNDDLIEEINNSLNQLNKSLNEKGTRLIVLAAVDKYDLYFDYIKSNRHKKNPFFEIMSKVKKDYIFIDTKRLFQKYLDEGIKDIYFADDTHWSPKGAKIVAEELIDIIGY